ncbi:plasmid pRiA4b ORF-3 family protein [Lentzea fradiae]|nr:plasmid pRiA4b ORF-3 family protein [Lentzea fradiae]
MPEQVRTFVRWVGDGRKLTQTGRVTLADAKALVKLLGTEDVIDPTIGDRVYRTGSSQELLHLTLIVEWAKAARLVRKTGNRLMQVKKNARLLDDEEALWRTLFTSFDQLGEAFLPDGFGESLLRREFAPAIRAVLAWLYHRGAPVPVEDLCEITWDMASAPYVLDHATELQLDHLRACNDRDTKQALEALRSLGAVTFENDAAELTELGRDGVRELLGQPSPGDPVHQLKITLLGVENPPVWRRVLLPAAVRLDDLHEIVQAAMGWENAHLHAFVDGRTQYSVPDPDLPYRDEREVRLTDLVKPGGRLLYVYDFGDHWEHEIVVEEVTAAEAGKSYPLCVAGQGDCPPEDCGGVAGYEHLVEILAKPDHPEHGDALDWLGLDDGTRFDPARFSLDEVNRRLLGA